MLCYGVVLVGGEVVIKNDITKPTEERTISKYNLFNLIINREEEYQKNGIVLDAYTVKDSRGQEWVTSEPIGLEVGAEIVITFSNNKTNGDYEDDIVKGLSRKA